MKRIIFLNRFFFPDHSATSQILSDLAFHLSDSGYEVTVITSRQRYDVPDALLPETETIRGIAVHRLATTRFGRSALLGRGFDYFSYYALMWRSVHLLAKRGDILVAKTDPPLLGVVAMRAAERRGLRLINWLQDLYPEIAVELGVPFVKGPLYRSLLHLRNASLRAAKANAVVGCRMAERLQSLGVAADRIAVIPNWCDDEDIRPVAHCDNPLRREWGLEGRLIVGYSGNLGKPHEFETVLAAAELLRNQRQIVFLFIGGGSKFSELEQLVKERSLENLFRFFPYQDRAELRYSIGVANIHWVSLKPDLEGLIVPSKFYGIAAAGRPIIAITARDGEIARLVQRHDCGLIVEPGQAERLADLLLSLSEDPHRLALMGHRAHQMLQTHFTRRQAFQRWSKLLEQIG
jgi:colanic acid biosynthesis glycosyl transferase WcaI